MRTVFSESFTRIEEAAKMHVRIPGVLAVMAMACMIPTATHAAEASEVRMARGLSLGFLPSMIIGGPVQQLQGS
jgi:hypothetical protein